MFLIFIEFKDLSKQYDKPNCIFTTRKTYNKREHTIKNVPCMNFSCDKCRRILKNKLFYNTIKTVDIFGMDKHIVLTSQGKQYRNKYNYQESYNHMGKSWTRLKQVMQYKYGAFDYISYPRAQGDGYCHYHIIANCPYIPQKFIDNKRKKYHNMGFVGIQQNKNLVEYLTNDFWKDKEYHIPKGVHHFNCSKEVAPYMNISGLYEKSEDNTFFKLEKTKGEIVDQYYDIVNNITGYAPPLHSLTEEFYKKVRQIDREERIRNNMFLENFKDRRNTWKCTK